MALPARCSRCAADGRDEKGDALDHRRPAVRPLQAAPGWRSHHLAGGLQSREGELGGEE